MRLLRIGLPLVLTAALILTSVGWYLSAHELSSQRFESCTLSDSGPTLTYMYGANQVVAPTVDSRGSDLVVSLEVREGGGVTPAIGLWGEASFLTFGEPESVRYPDGTELECAG